jgi:hypothetical protein
MARITRIQITPEPEAEPDQEFNAHVTDSDEEIARDGDDEIKEIKPTKYMAISALNEKHYLNKNNWADWSRRIILILCASGLYKYVLGQLVRPNRAGSPTSAAN